MSASPRRILLVLLMPIGDTLFATPTIRALRKTYPAARIVALAYPTNAGILESNPDIDRLLLHPTAKTWQGWRHYAGFLWRLNRMQFDLAVHFGPAQWWFAQLIRPRTRRRLQFPLWQWFVPLGPRPWKTRHAMTSYATLLMPSELENLAEAPVLTSTQEDRDAVSRTLGNSARGNIVAIHPGGEGFRGMKRWPAARYIGLARALNELHRARILVLGGPEEAELGRAIAAAVPGAHSLAGELNLGQTVAVLERCALFVGNDSAPMHMAAAVGIPTIGIFGPTSVANFRPRGRRVEVVHAGLACSPCFHFVGSHPVWSGSRCRVPSCLHAVSTRRVLDAAARYLR
ncbi:MAG: glycosyl transferase family 9 [Chloroflexi bacterium]|nr:glycosyl transferase family 9 [Chloroflexota bacterium]